eukprot:GHVU01070887.1.p4 GENE.GHVU01070887.1~~GHVU01070887.1.p4  ORF type:complete len:104 (-),score=25.43 GHVU01070887.1:278-589(-)
METEMAAFVEEVCAILQADTELLTICGYPCADTLEALMRARPSPESTVHLDCRRLLCRALRESRTPFQRTARYYSRRRALLALYKWRDFLIFDYPEAGGGQVS